MFSLGWVTCTDQVPNLLHAQCLNLYFPSQDKELLTVLIMDFFLKGETSVHGTAASPKEGNEEGSENDHGVPSSKKMQGERGGGAALKENVCQVVSLKKSL